jgi:hypothetical protein
VPDVKKTLRRLLETISNQRKDHETQVIEKKRLHQPWMRHVGAAEALAMVEHRIEGLLKEVVR